MLPMEQQKPRAGWGALETDRPTESTNPKDLLGVKKVNLALIPPAGEIHQARAFEVGAAKYGPFNWREKSVSMMVYIAAMKRHLARILDGEDNEIDPRVPELGPVDHLGNIMACAAIILDAREVGRLIDDRPAPGRAAELLASFDRSTGTLERADGTAKQIEFAETEYAEAPWWTAS